MGTKYATVSVSGYNSSPPADNGSTDATNQILWSTIKTKLPDPLKTAIEAVNSALVSYTDTSVRSITASDSTVAGDHLKTVQTASSVTAVVTISLMDATTAAAGYMVRVHNGGLANLTVGRATGTDTINGALKNVVLGLGQSALFVVNSTTNGYLMVGGNTPITDATDPSKQLKFDVSGITTGTVRTLTVPDVSDTLVTLSATQELDNKTLDSSVGKGTWTASGTWTLPAFTLGGTVSGGGNQINNVIIGAVTPLAISGTTGTFSGAVTAAGTGGTLAATLSMNANTTGQPAYFTASGTDTNVGIDFNTKGTGAIRLNVNGGVIGNVSATGLSVTGTLGVTNNIDLTEMTAPSGTANTARIFAVDNGSGKTVLKVIFGSGAAQQIAIEP